MRQLHSCYWISAPQCPICASPQLSMSCLSPACSYFYIFGFVLQHSFHYPSQKRGSLPKTLFQLLNPSSLIGGVNYLALTCAFKHTQYFALRFPLIPKEWLSSRSQIITNYGDRVGNRKLCSLLVGMLSNTTTVKVSMESPQKTAIRNSIWCTIPPLSLFLEELITSDYSDPCPAMLIAA